MRYAYDEGIPVVPGRGTGMSGGAVPLRDSVVLSMEKMNRILDLDKDNLTVLVEPNN